MEMSQDGLQLWEMSGAIAAAIGLALRFGRVPSKGYWVKRSEQPGLFWFAISLLGAVLVVLVVWALFLTLPQLP